MEPLFLCYIWCLCPSTLESSEESRWKTPQKEAVGRTDRPAAEVACTHQQQHTIYKMTQCWHLIWNLFDVWRSKRTAEQRVVSPSGTFIIPPPRRRGWERERDMMQLVTFIQTEPSMKAVLVFVVSTTISRYSTQKYTSDITSLSLIRSEVYKKEEPVRPASGTWKRNMAKFAWCKHPVRCAWNKGK